MLRTPFDFPHLRAPGGAIPDLQVVVDPGDDDVPAELRVLEQRRGEHDPPLPVGDRRGRAGEGATVPRKVPRTRIERPPASSLASVPSTFSRTVEPGRQLTSPRTASEPRERSLSVDASRPFRRSPTNSAAVRPEIVGKRMRRSRRASVSLISSDHQGGESREPCWIRTVRTFVPSSHLPHQTYVLPCIASGMPSAKEK